MKAMFIGVGDCGCNIADYLSRRNIGDFEYLCINTDSSGFERLSIRDRLLIGRSVANGEGCGFNPDLGRLSAESAKSEIEYKLAGADAVLICAGMGGGTGGGASSVIARAVIDVGIPAFQFAIMPFNFEGRLVALADAAVESLPEYLPWIQLCNTKLMDVLGESTLTTDAFAAMSDEIAKIAIAISVQQPVQQPLHIPQSCRFEGNRHRVKP